MNSLCLIGCGKMGSSLLKGWIKSKISTKIIIVEPKPLDLNEFCSSEIDLIFLKKIDQLIGFEDLNVVVFAVKPQIIEKVLSEFKPFVDKFNLIISIIAGKTINYFERKLGKNIQFIRAMPNTPAEVGEGITAMVKNKKCKFINLKLSRHLLEDLGEVIEVNDEKFMDVVTAISGSGPAYFYYLVEVLVATGIKLGLEKNLAYKLASTTFIGSGILAKKSNQTYTELRRSVTSPGGTTEAGLNVLIKNEKFHKLIEKTIKSAKAKSKELGKV